jgi:23S rRNA (uracil1939-C5)-methyltransferase
LSAATATASFCSERRVTERLAVARMGRFGDGISDTPAGPVYVPYALPGETVRVAPWPGRHPDRRQLIEVQTASAERIAPVCPHFGVCGGCALQHWATARYREWKRGLVVAWLKQAELDAPVDDLIDAHGEGRRRAVFHARPGAREVLEVGYTARKFHHVVAIDRCPVLAPSLAGAIAAAWALAEAVADAHKSLDIQVTATDAGLDIDLRGSGPLSGVLIAQLAALAQRHGLARLTRHGEMVAQHAPPSITVGRAKVVLPPGGFLQATAAGELALAQPVTAYCSDARNIADLFCGIGPFALRLAEGARVSAADNDAAAVAALARAAKETQGLKPIETQVRDLFRRPFFPDELAAFDAVVFDPPRQGAEAQARALAASTVPTVITVSCNPTTLARDTRILVDGGYRLARVTPIDQFLFSNHVEVVALFQRTDDGGQRTDK